ncbi:hypothetical protein JWR97_15570, partial [Pseudomonas cedrina subsp. fulgida]|nr:hypothetical protein [Pseudomonas cedrina subsp. fulgida]
PRSAWECRPGRSASALEVVTRSVTGCIPTQSVGMINPIPLAPRLVQTAAEKIRTIGCQCSLSSSTFFATRILY